jgi:hypothetical protein
MRQEDPTELSRDVAEKVDGLATCLATDVEIGPVQVIVPLIMTSACLHRVVDELNRAAISVDEECAAALRRAGVHFLRARDQIQQALVHLPQDPPAGVPRGRLHGRPRNLDPLPDWRRRLAAMRLWGSTRRDDDIHYIAPRGRRSVAADSSSHSSSGREGRRFQRAVTERNRWRTSSTMDGALVLSHAA